MMELLQESPNARDYLSETEEVDYLHPLVQELIDNLFGESMSDIEIAEKAFLFVRDEIAHSWDIRSRRITRKASEVLMYREGICYAKSNLLAAILRAQGIPAGFCYQRLTLGDTPDTGYSLHALNAVYLQSIGRWVRLDARGNKEGVNALFSLEREYLAFPIRDFYDEIDYSVIYAKPNAETMRTLLDHSDCIEMYLHGLPARLR